MIAVLAFVGVAALVGGAALLLRAETGQQDRRPPRPVDRRHLSRAAKDAQAKEASILAQPLDDKPGIFQSFVERFGNINLLFEQADTSLTVGKLAAISAVFAVIGIALGAVVRHPSRPDAR